MKRVKVMLSAVAVVAVVGGALAFTAKKTELKCIYTKTTTGTTALFTKTDVLSTATTSTTTVPFATTIIPVGTSCPTTASVPATRLLFTFE